MKYNDQLNLKIAEVAEVAGYLWEKGWAERNGGNISVNVTEEAAGSLDSLPAISEQFLLEEAVGGLSNNYFLVTGTNRRMRYVASAPMENMSIIRIDDSGSSYVIVAQKPVRPTSELPSHLAMHNFLIERGVANKVVVHTHPTNLIAMTHNPKYLQKDVLGNLLWSMIPETRVIIPRGLGIVPYCIPGTMTLAKETIKLLDSYDVVMWEKHGCLAVGADIIEAFDMIDTFAKSADIYLQAKMAGFEPEGMTQQQSFELACAFNLL